MLVQSENERIKRIRISERNSHTEIYLNEELYKSDSWLNKPIKTVVDLIPCFKDYKTLNVLDLGCGVGRNCIAVAQAYKNIVCNVDCVDLLELAIEKLCENAITHNVEAQIHGIVQSIEEYKIEKEKYDLIMAISALEHINSKDSFQRKIVEIRNGVRQNGIVCFVINSNVQEWDKKTKEGLDAQFEVNFPTDELKALLQDVFGDWEVMKFTTQEQHYDIPRELGVCELDTNVVTLVASKS